MSEYFFLFLKESPTFISITFSCQCSMSHRSKPSSENDPTQTHPFRKRRRVRMKWSTIDILNGSIDVWTLGETASSRGFMTSSNDTSVRGLLLFLIYGKYFSGIRWSQYKHINHINYTCEYNLVAYTYMNNKKGKNNMELFLFLPVCVCVCVRVEGL